MTAASFKVTIAGRRLEVSGDDAVAAVGTAFSGIFDQDADPAHATLEIEKVSDPAGRYPWNRLEIGSHRFPDGALAVIRRGPSSVETFLPGPVPRLHLAASPDALGSGVLRSQPANHAIASWLASSMVQAVHAAAVSLDGQGLLLVGVGGRGKSTTALACALAGFSFLGDDMCVVEVGSAERRLTPRIHGVYATAKLNRDSQERLGSCDFRLLGVTPLGKSTFALPPEIRFDRAAPLVAVVGFRAGDASADTVRLLSGPEAMGLLAATAAPLATGSGTAALWLQAAVAIAREVPAYELRLGWDLDRVVADCRSIIDRSGEDRPPRREPILARTNRL